MGVLGVIDKSFAHNQRLNVLSNQNLILVVVGNPSAVCALLR